MWLLTQSTPPTRLTLTTTNLIGIPSYNIDKILTKVLKTEQLMWIGIVEIFNLSGFHCKGQNQKYPYLVNPFKIDRTNSAGTLKNMILIIVKNQKLIHLRHFQHIMLSIPAAKQITFCREFSGNRRFCILIFMQQLRLQKMCFDCQEKNFGESTAYLILSFKKFLKQITMSSWHKPILFWRWEVIA